MMLDANQSHTVRHYLLTLPNRVQRRWIGFGGLLGLLAVLALVTRPDTQPAALALPGARATVTPPAAVFTPTPAPASAMPGMSSVP